jgi:hypothetical protein
MASPASPPGAALERVTQLLIMMTPSRKFIGLSAEHAAFGVGWRFLPDANNATLPSLSGAWRCIARGPDLAQPARAATFISESGLPSWR